MALCGEDGRELKAPLLCRFDFDGKVVHQQLGASEVGEFIRLILKVPTQPRNELRSHSCKTTVLSWMAKYGVPVNLRRIAGHHLDPSSKSAETYSRDSMSQSLRAVCEVVGAIRAGRFQPDQTRSGRFVQVGAEHGEHDDSASNTSFEMPFSERLAGDTDDTATDSSSDNASDNETVIDDATTLWQLIRPELRPPRASVKTGLEQFAHTISGVVHLRQPAANKFLCGRVLSARYESGRPDASTECPKCTTCFVQPVLGARMLSQIGDCAQIIIRPSQELLHPFPLLTTAIWPTACGPPTLVTKAPAINFGFPARRRSKDQYCPKKLIEKLKLFVL